MKKCVLGDVADVIVSGVDKKTKDGEEKVRLCNYTDVYYNWAITGDKYDGLMKASAKPEEIRKFKIRKGQVALTKDSETRDDIGIPTYIADDFEDVILGYHCALITPYDKQLDGSYLNALLRTKYAKEFFANNAGGSGQRYYLSDASIKELPLFLPDFAEQKRIGKFFSSIDRKIALNRKRIATLEAMAKEIYDYWFVQFDFPDAHGRPYKSSGGAMVYNPDLKREIPKGWEVKPLGELMKTNASSYNERTLPSRIRYIDIAAVSNGVVSSKTEYDRDRAPGRARRIAKRGDTIWSSVRPNLRAYALVLNPQEDDVFSTGFTVLSPVEVPYGFLYLTVTTEAYVSYLVSRTGNSAYPAVLPSAFGEYEIAVPPRDLLDRFADQTEGMFELRQNCFDEIQSQSSLRDFLLPVLMNGQVKVG